MQREQLGPLQVHPDQVDARDAEGGRRARQRRALHGRLCLDVVLDVLLAIGAEERAGAGVAVRPASDCARRVDREECAGAVIHMHGLQHEREAVGARGGHRRAQRQRLRVALKGDDARVGKRLVKLD